MFSEELDVSEHVSGKFSNCARSKPARSSIRIARDVLVEIEPVSQFQLKKAGKVKVEVRVAVFSSP